MTIPLKAIKSRWLKDPSFKKGYDALADEFEIASMLIEARSRAKLSQAQLAKKMRTSQSTIARLESGVGKPSISTLQRFAQATGTRLRLTLEPASTKTKRKAGRASVKVVCGAATLCTALLFSAQRTVRHARSFPYRRLLPGPTVGCQAGCQHTVVC
jgi:transcriptional regulator with XRE-family HTH domain